MDLTPRGRQREQQHLQSTRAASRGEGTVGIIGDSMLGDHGNKHQWGEESYLVNFASKHMNEWQNGLQQGNFFKDLAHVGSQNGD